MSNQFGFIDIILLAMFAGFIILRLRNILGRKTGHEGKPMSSYFPKGMEVLKDIENNEAIKSGNVNEEAKKQFLKGADVAYEQIITSFANGDNGVAGFDALGNIEYPAVLKSVPFKLS